MSCSLCTGLHIPFTRVLVRPSARSEASKEQVQKLLQRLFELHDLRRIPETRLVAVFERELLGQSATQGLVNVIAFEYKLGVWR